MRGHLHAVVGQPTATVPASDLGELLHLPIVELEPNPHQPRRIFDPEDLQELAESIAQLGVLQPVLAKAPVTPGGNWTIIAGERRWRAAAIAGLDCVPVLTWAETTIGLYGTSVSSAAVAAIAENLTRVDLNPIELAAAYASLMKENGLRSHEVAELVAKPADQVRACVALLRLPDSVQAKVGAGVLSQKHARHLVALENPEDAEALAEVSIRRGLTANQLAEVIATGGYAKTRKSKSKSGASSKKVDSGAGAARFGEVVEKLEDTLDSRVKITAPTSGVWKLSIDIADAEDLMRVVSVICDNRQAEAGPVGE